MDSFHYAAGTYPTLGYGDILPLGELRLFASIGPLNGILLMAWSVAFLFSVRRSQCTGPAMGRELDQLFVA